MATQPPPEFPPRPSQPLEPDGPPPEISPPVPDVDVPAPGEQPTGPANPS
ncbi:MAG: hypothetical protein JSR79_01240 [Proteobacteria bacterium]|nr:hypothetical protein [Pseudomonadota bacterium]